MIIFGFYNIENPQSSKVGKWGIKRKKEKKQILKISSFPNFPFLCIVQYKKNSTKFNITICHFFSTNFSIDLTRAQINTFSKIYKNDTCDFYLIID